LGFVGLVEVGSLAVNVSSLMAASIGSQEHRALTVHCVFRLLALVALVLGYVSMRRSAGEADKTTLAKAG
jgi:hypothetical protein